MAIDVPPVARKILRFWEIPFLAILVGFMFWVRMLPYKVLVGGDRAYYIGTDPFYHYRETLGIVRAFPRIPRFDPYTYYPYGTGTGQFGGLFDWAAAAVVVVSAGRDASEEYVAQVLGAFPAVLGALIIVPFYFLAKRLVGTPGAIVGSLTLAVLPGEFLVRSIAGYSDHHVAEALMALVSILGIVVAITRGHQMRERLVDLTNFKSIRAPLAWGLLGGVALAANYFAWPPAILFLAILTIWLTIVVLLENGSGGDARGYVFGAAVAFTTAGFLMLPAVETTFLGEFNTFGLLQVVASWAAAAGLVAVHVISRRGEDRVRTSWMTAGGLGALAILGFFSLRWLAPSIYASFRWGLSWITGIAVPRTTLTISEAREAAFFCVRDTRAESCLATDFGYVAPVAVLILLAVGAFAVWKRRYSDILIFLWSLVIFLATATQIRFSYYLALNLALLIAWFGARIVEMVGGMPRTEAPTAAAAKSTKGRKTKGKEAATTRARPIRALAAGLVLLLVIPGNVFGVEMAPADPERGLGASRSEPGWLIASKGFPTPDGDLVMWMDELEWVRANTPDGGVDLGRIVDRPAPGERYVQEEGSYGILSWWDYGHWMEVVARRAPVANPFQQAAPFASCWLTERDPARAEAWIMLWSAGSFPRVNNDQACGKVELPAPSELPASDENPIRYVMIDDQMAGGKFGAITVWAGCDTCVAFNSSNSQPGATTRDAYYHGLFKYWRTYLDEKNGERLMPWSGEPYADTMLARLYFEDGNRLSNYRLVHESPYGVRIGWVAGFDAQGIFSHNQNDFLSSRQTWPPQQWGRVTDDGRALPTADGKYVYEAKVVASVKTYERVKGALVTGSGALPGQDVHLLINLRSDSTGRSFTYEAMTLANADGTWSIRSPYATSDIQTPENGGTNLAVRAVGPAQIWAGDAFAPTAGTDAEIPDRAVLDGETVRVQLL